MSNALKLHSKQFILFTTIYNIGVHFGNERGKEEAIHMKKFPKNLAASAMMLTVLAGCGQSGGGSTELNDGDTVKVGLNYELSGKTATYGLAMEKGSQLAIKQYNERTDKKYTIEVVSQDCKSDATEALSIATKLMTEEGVAFQVGPATSTDALSTYPVSTDAKVPVLSPAVTLNDGMLQSDGEAYPYAWRTCFEDRAQASAMAIYAYDNLGKRKAVVYADSANEYATGLADDFIKKFESLGGEIVASENYVQGDTDFNAVISKLTDMDFDVMYVPGYYGEAGLIIKQARAAGLDQTILGPDGMDSPKLAELAGASALNNVYFTTAYTTVNASDDLLSFIEAYKAEYNEEPDMFSVLAYDATNLGLQALEEAGATGEKLNEAIKNIQFSGLTGSFTFDDAHTPTKKVLVVELQDGVQVKPVEVDPNAE